MTFLLKLICNIFILLVVYISGIYVWEYLHLHFFLDWTKDNAWMAVTVVTVTYGILVSSILFSMVEALLPS